MQGQEQAVVYLAIKILSAAIVLKPGSDTAYFQFRPVALIQTPIFFPAELNSKEGGGIHCHVQ